MYLFGGVIYALIITVLTGDYARKEIRLNEPRFLADGLLVTGADDTRNHVATWVVLLTITAPSEIPGFQQKIEQFKTALLKLRDIPSFNNRSMEGWIDRLAELEQSMYIPQPPRRQRRGLLNIFGQISKTLFGVATDEDVSECKRQLRQVGKVNQRIVHSLSQMLSVVNQTHIQQVEDRKHILGLERYISEMSNEMRFLETHLSQQDNFLQVINSQVRIDQVLSAMKSAHDTWLRQVDKFNRQVASLELGFLTEELLSRQEIVKILTAGRRAGFESPSIHWYYENIRVYPISRYERQLIFRIKLPLTDSVLYKRYYLTSWPIPSKSHNFTVQLRVSNDVAINPLTGGMYEPTACQGKQPMLCRAGAIYNRFRFECPRGILTGEVNLRKKCKVTIRPQTDTDTTVTELFPGTFVIVTYGEQISLLCANEPERRLTLTGGAYALRLQQGCYVKASGWTITSIARLSSNVSVDFAVISTPPLSLLQTLPHDKIKHHFDNPVWGSMGEIKNIPLDRLAVDSEVDTQIWGSYPGHISWTALIGFIGVAVALMGIILVMYRKQIITLPTWAMKRSAQEPAGSLDSADIARRNIGVAAPNLPEAWQTSGSD